MTSLGQAYLPLFKQSFSTYSNYFKERNRRLQHYLFPLYMLLLVSSNYLFEVLYGGRFGEAVLIFDLMILLIILRFINTNAIFISLDEEKTLFTITWQEVLVNIAVSLSLLPILGLAGIVAGTLIANLFEKIRSVWYLHKIRGITWQDYMPSGTYWFYSLLLLMIFVIKHILLTIF
jgi:peptidoglycan biosynthesis protein MviN/MurJ (putative lipid II flippase)